MCLPLIGKVVALTDDYAEVQLLEGEIVQASRAVQPEADIGSHVLVDRGLIVEIVAPEEVEHMLAFFTELTEMWAVEDAAHA